MRGARAAQAVLTSLVLCSAASAEEVQFDIQSTIVVGETEAAYRLDVVVSVADTTRVGVEALLDLRDFQERMPSLLMAEPLMDSCGSRADLIELSVSVEEDVVSATGLIDRQVFECTRRSETIFERGALTEEALLDFNASASAKLEGKCIDLQLLDLSVVPQEENADPTLTEDLNTLKLILIEVVSRFLEERPVCPELPAELAMLDPVYESGGPREIGDGGLGFYLNGSVDVSTSTIIGILQILQDEQIIPGPP